MIQKSNQTIKVPAISREPTPMIVMNTYIPSEPDYDPMSEWPNHFKTKSF